MNPLSLIGNQILVARISTATMIATSENINEPEHYHQTTSPEIRLLFAILERAIADVFSIAKTEDVKTDRVRALQWIYSPLQPEKSFSFAWVCNHSNFCPLQLRKAIDKMRDEQRRPKRHRRQRINPYPTTLRKVK